MSEPNSQSVDDLRQIVALLLRRQNELEQRIAQLESPNLEVPKAAPGIVPTVLQSPPVTPPAAKPDPIPHPSRQFETKVGLTILNRVGVVTLVLGLAFFFRWAVDNDWLGPVTRILVGLIAATAALAAGELFWRKRQHTFAQGIAGLGLAVLYLSFYAGYGFYQLFPIALAFFLMLAASGLAAALALRYRSQAVACLGFLGGYLTPLLLSDGTDRPIFLLTYLLLLSAATAALTKKHVWRWLELLSFFFTFGILFGWLFRSENFARPRLFATAAVSAYFVLYSRLRTRPLFLVSQLLTALAIETIWTGAPAPFFAFSLLLAAAGFYYAERIPLPVASTAAFVSFWFSYALWCWDGPAHATIWPELLGASIAALCFFALATWRLASNPKPITGSSLSALALNGVFYYAAAYDLLRSSYHGSLGLLALAVAAAYVACGLYLRRLSAEKESDPVLLSLAMALAFFTLAIPIQLTGFSITIAWSLEAAALAWIASRLGNHKILWTAAAVSLLLLVRLALFDAEIYRNAHSYSFLVNLRFFTFAAAGCSLLFSSRYAARLIHSLGLAQYGLGHAVLLSGLSLEVLGWTARSSPPADLLSAQSIAISILFATYALLLIGLGFATQTRLNRIAGLALIGLVIVKLYVFDIWLLQRFYRVSALVALGVLLISSSFLYSRFRAVIEGLLKPENTPD